MKECWLSAEVALAFPLSLFAMLQQAAGRYGPSCQRNFKSSLFPSVLIHVAQPWTSHPSLPPSCSTPSLTRVCREWNDGRSRGKSRLFRRRRYSCLARAQWTTGRKKLRVSFCVITFLGNRGSSYSLEICIIHFAVCCSLPDWKTNAPGWLW